MPVYCYSRGEGESLEVVERIFPMGKQPRTVRHGGKVFKRNMLAEHGGFKHAPGLWPKLSLAMGCHPDQVGEKVKEFAAAGVQVDYKVKGGMAHMVIRDRAHRRQVHKAAGFFDRSAGYGDRAPD